MRCTHTPVLPGELQSHACLTRTDFPLTSGCACRGRPARRRQQYAKAAATAACGLAAGTNRALLHTKSASHPARRSDAPRPSIWSCCAEGHVHELRLAMSRSPGAAREGPFLAAEHDELRGKEEEL